METTALLTVLVVVLAIVLIALVVLLSVVLRGATQPGRPARRSDPRRGGGPSRRPASAPAPVAQVSTAHDEELKARRQAVDRREELLAEREDRLNRYLEEVHNRESHLDDIAAGLDRREAQLDEAEAERADALAAVAGLSADAARAELMTQVEKESRLHAAQLTREIESEARRTADATARRIVVTSIQRLAAEQTTESVVATVPLPSDEMKGRIIGREGRNIRAFEQITGVNVLIDDTPESVLLSCFDPVRRETARLTLTELVADGRIHPARIEEVHERSRRSVDELCIRAAEDALIEMGITDLAPGLLPVLGSLQYRTSYGQNVLRHLVECGHIAALLAAELGLDVETCKRAAFLHDIGKALTHEAEGSHAKVGADLARRHGEHPDIVHAIEAHHNEVEPRTVEAVLTQAADAISGSRPGARRESLEIYVKRLQRLEDIAKEHEGVDKVFAMQAGREIRVMVAPELVNDAQSQVIARDIAKRVEEELTYPGSIKVTVVRESRAVALAK
ncbi:MAG: ribonuclease Y [Propionicimonas sp.]|uniref:ribonuclease Y n=1 Tax=Propionicimonas sp. TaxID=1955623 RepID=UPI003D0D4479